jgi:protein SCO1/2
MNSMTGESRRRGQAVWALLGIGLVFLTILAVVLRERWKLEPLPVLGRIAGFSLTNQVGQPVTEESLRGQIWVADIIFTRCPGPCVLMTRNLAQLQGQLRERDEVRLVSLTADPGHDTVDELRRYGERYEAIPSRWHFLTGSKEELYRLAINDLKLSTEEIDPTRRENLNDLFIHSTKMVLIDTEGQVRGYFEGTDAEVPGRLLGAIRRLQRGG